MSEQEQSRGPSRFGKTVLLTSAAVILLLVAAYYLLRAKRGGEPAYRATCQSSLHEIGLACHMYADYHEARFPPDLLALASKYTNNPLAFCCASTGSRGEFRDMDLREAAAESQYTYAGAGLWVAGCPEDMILAYDNSLENHDGKGRNVAFADTHVEWWPASREAEFQKKLAAQREAVKKWRAAGAKKEDLEKFFGKLGEKEPK